MTFGGEGVKNQTIIVQSIASIFVVISIAFGRTLNFPDAVSKMYGFPLKWGIHQL